MAPGLMLFDALCHAADVVERQRQPYDPASQEWLALTQLIDQIDALIDALVRSAPLEEAGHGEAPHRRDPDEVF